jgi:hypothetical protein
MLCCKKNIQPLEEEVELHDPSYAARVDYAPSVSLSGYSRFVLVFFARAFIMATRAVTCKGAWRGVNGFANYH